MRVPLASQLCEAVWPHMPCAASAGGCAHNVCSRSLLGRSGRPIRMRTETPSDLTLAAPLRSPRSAPLRPPGDVM
eukprot:10210003-Heterocapsa_arctica.AAC.1